MQTPKYFLPKYYFIQRRFSVSGLFWNNFIFIRRKNITQLKNIKKMFKVLSSLQEDFLMFNQSEMKLIEYPSLSLSESYKPFTINLC